jgi:hypothetical protein
MFAAWVGVLASVAAAGSDTPVTVLRSFTRDVGECTRTLEQGPASEFAWMMDRAAPDGFVESQRDCIRRYEGSQVIAGCSIRIDERGVMGTERRLLFVRDLAERFVRDCRRDGGEVAPRPERY